MVSAERHLEILVGKNQVLQDFGLVQVLSELTPEFEVVWQEERMERSLVSEGLGVLVQVRFLLLAQKTQSGVSLVVAAEQKHQKKLWVLGSLVKELAQKEPQELLEWRWNSLQGRGLFGKLVWVQF